MRTIERTAQFKKDFKRESKGRHRAALHADFVRIVTLLAQDLPLPVSQRDHTLSGEWKDFRDCHIKPDLVLIYSKPDSDRLTLARLGSHSELGW
jgi:mRNA interferase YafQ